MHVRNAHMPCHERIGVVPLGTACQTLVGPACGHAGVEMPGVGDVGLLSSRAPIGCMPWRAVLPPSSSRKRDRLVDPPEPPPPRP